MEKLGVIKISLKKRKKQPGVVRYIKTKGGGNKKNLTPNERGVRLNVRERRTKKGWGLEKPKTQTKRWRGPGGRRIEDQKG